MKNGKRIMAAILAAILALSMTSAAFADEIEDVAAPAADTPEPIVEVAPDESDAPVTDGTAVVEQIGGTYHQTEARSILPLLNDFRLTEGVSVQNAGGGSQTSYNVPGGVYLSELSYDYDLERIAMQRAAEIAVSLSHMRPDGTAFYTCTVNGHYSWAENIHRGSTTAEWALSRWSEAGYSYEYQAHRRLLLTDKYTAVGAACFEFEGVYYWAMELGYETGAEATAATDGEAVVPVTYDIETTYEDLREEMIPAITGASNLPSGVCLTWDAVPGAEEYQVERRDEDGIWRIVGTTGDPGFTDGTVSMASYSYRVRAYTRRDGWGIFSESVSVAWSPFTDVASNASYIPALCWAYNNRIVSGTSSQTFSPSDPCTRGQFALMLYRLIGRPSTLGLSSPFTDVAHTDSYWRAVLWAYNEGVVKGTGETTFSPSGTVTRGQIVLMLYRMAGRPAVGDVKSPFSDVKEGSAYYQAILWAYENGIVKGTGGGRFSPNANCTRYQLVTILYRYNSLLGIL